MSVLPGRPSGWSNGMVSLRTTQFQPEEGASLMDSAMAAGEEALLASPVSSLRRMAELNNAQVGEPLRIEDARQQVEAAGLRGHLTIPDQSVPQAYLDVLIDRKREELRRAELIASAPQGAGPTATRFAASFAASLFDPINLATAYVPVISQARYARMLAAAKGFAGRTVVRAGVGAVEGLAGAAMVEPLIAAAKSQEQADYDMADSLANIAFGTVFGGGLHVVGGAGADAIRGLREPTRIEWGVAELGAATPPGVRAARVAQQRTELANFFDGLRQATEAKPPSEGELRAQIESTLDKLVPEAPPATLKEMADEVETLVLRDTPITSEMLDATLLGKRIVEKSNLLGEMLQEVKPLVEASRPITREMLEETLTRLTAGKGKPKPSPGVISELLAEADALVQRAPVTAADLERTVTEPPLQRNAPATVRAERAGPVKREAALKTAVVQMVNGKSVNGAEPILNGDTAAAKRAATDQAEALMDPVPEPMPRVPDDTGLDAARESLEDLTAVLTASGDDAVAEQLKGLDDITEQADLVARIVRAVAPCVGRTSG